MPNFDLNRLGEKEFERLSQSLLKEIIGNGTITFGDGPDGGREATFQGKAPYPSLLESWDGNWIFQAKFHDIQKMTLDEARRTVVSDLKSELTKIVKKYKHKCDNYILITNVQLSSVHERGTHDRIVLELVPDFIDAISHIHVWGADDLYRFLEKYPNIRQNYLPFITPGDLIAKLMQSEVDKSKRIIQAIQKYTTVSFSRERYAQLDQAGQVAEKRTLLKDVFIDLEVQFIHPRDYKRFLHQDDTVFENHIGDPLEKTFSSAQVILSEKLSKIVLIGGPGEGKSTLGQYLAQIHRATLLNRLNELSKNPINILPLVARIPFRIILKDYAQWLEDTKDKEDGLEFYLCEDIYQKSAYKISPEELQSIFQNNPCFLILDGLDEITEKNLQNRVLDRINEFIDSCEHVLEANIQVLATSRPTSYSGQFDSHVFTHVQLSKLKPEKVTEYVNNWIQAKEIDDSGAYRLKQTIKECLLDYQIRLLMNTPLQVTILIFVILSGGTPPRQREALFNEYLEVIYKRESAKAIIRTSKAQLFELHEYLGYLLQKRSSQAKDVKSLIKKEEFEVAIKDVLRHSDPYVSATVLNARTAAIVKEAGERLVLIVEPEAGFFGFELRSIQEFFAAAHLANAPDDLRQKRFEAIARLSYWRNVALFFVGRISRISSAAASSLITSCRLIDQEKPDSLLHRGALLSLDLAIERSFGHKRGLQYSVLEYGLTLLDNLSSIESIYDIETTLQKLPEEDIQELVIPILKQRMLLPLPASKKAFEICLSLDNSHEIILDALDHLLNSSTNDKDILFVFQQAFRFKINADWVSIRLIKFFSLLPLDSLFKSIEYTAITMPEYTRQCLKLCSLERDHITALLEHVFSTVPFRYSRKQLEETKKAKPSFDSKKLSMLDEQMYCTLHMCNFIQTILFLLVEDQEVNERLLSSMRKELFFDISPEFFEEAKKMLENHSSEFLLHFKVCLWLSIFFFQPLLLPKFESFISLYEEASAYKNVREFLNECGSMYPLLAGIIEIAKQKIVIDINDICLLQLGQFPEHYGPKDQILLKISQLNEGQKRLLFLLDTAVLRKEEDVYIQKISKDIINVDMRLFYLLMNKNIFHPLRKEKVFFDKEQLKMLFELLDRRRNEYADILPRFSRVLSQTKWFIDDEIIENIASLIKNINNTSSKSPLLDSNISIKLFNKFYDCDTPDRNKIIPIIKSFTNIKISNLDRSTIRSRPLVSVRRFSDLIDLLFNEDKDVCLGAANILVLALSAFYSQIRRKVGSRPLNGREYDFQVSYELIQDLMGRTGVIFKCVGINLLYFCDDDYDKDFHLFVSEILLCDNKLLKLAWSSFIHNIPLNKGNEQKLRFQFLLEKLLEKEYLLDPSIQAAAFFRYKNLVLSHEDETPIDEQTLNLPFYREND